MDFDINKYDDSIFHNDDEINLKIKALLLWFDHQCFKNDLDTERMIVLIDGLINTAVREEWYEVADFFKDKKADLIKSN
jgi:hypothetical protein